MVNWYDCIVVPHPGQGDPFICTGREQAENEREWRTKYMRVLSPRCAFLHANYKDHNHQKVAQLLEVVKRTGRDTNEPHDNY